MQIDAAAPGSNMKLGNGKAVILIGKDDLNLRPVYQRLVLTEPDQRVANGCIELQPFPVARAIFFLPRPDGKPRRLRARTAGSGSAGDDDGEQPTKDTTAASQAGGSSR